jgi:N-acyl-D-amino-acid deacylase
MTTLIKNGTIIDGSGNPGFKGSILFDRQKISSVIRDGETAPAADVVIDAEGLVVAPGFIDMHSHADWVLPAEQHPEILKCLVEQGVTSIVGGNCGISPAPVGKMSADHVEKLAAIMVARPFDYQWKSMGEYLACMADRQPMVNLAELVGHAAIHYSTAETLRRALKPEEMQNCLTATEKALSEGACGLSFGLGYDPGMYTPIEELEAFCAVAAKADKPVTVHLKALSRLSPCYPLTTPKAHNVLALEEMLGIARKTGIKLQLSHFIFVGRRSWPTVETCLQLVEEARNDGVDVMIDAFPYTCGNTTILAPFPYWFLAGLPDAYNGFWPRTRLRAELGLGLRLVGFIYKDFQVMDSAVAGWEDLNGLRMTEVAEKWGCSPFNAMLRLAQESNGAALMLFHTYSGEAGNEKPLEQVLSHELCLFETDVAIKASGYPNPTGLGTFPKILGTYARDKGLFSIENAVRKMTSASADRFGLQDIGRLEPGKAADVVLFDPDEIADSPPINGGPYGKPKGIHQVFINGAHVVRDGSYITGVRAGRIL